MITNHTAETLIEFENEIAADFNAGKIRYPVHLSSGGEEELLQIFQAVRPDDWVFSYWRSHYHCLLKGVEPERLKQDIYEGRSIAMTYPDKRVFATAIVGGQISIALGTALTIKRQRDKEYLETGNVKTIGMVWCFLGDMTAETGAFHEALRYASGHALPIHFVVEDNARSVATDTKEAWGHGTNKSILTRYTYTRKRPHSGTGHWVEF